MAGSLSNRVYPFRSSDRINAVGGEEAVYSAAVAWLRAQTPSPTEDDAAALLRLVRFPLLSQDFVRATVRREPLLRTVVGMEMLNDALLAALHGGSPVRPRRMAFEKVYAVTRADGSVVRYDPLADAWERIPIRVESTVMRGSALSAVDGKLYALGGSNGGGPESVSSVKRYDPATNAWEAMVPMPTARQFLEASGVDGKIYALGGYAVGEHGGSALRSVERYDPATNAWEVMTPMPTGRFNFTVAVVDGKIYALGGFDGRTLSTVERYDPATNAWEVVAPMPGKRSCLVAAVVDGKLYALGGRSADKTTLSTVERYDPATNAWEVVAPMPTARSSLAASGVDGKLYALGGLSADKTALSTVERYDPATNAWEAVASVPPRDPRVGPLYTCVSM